MTDHSSKPSVTDSSAPANTIYSVDVEESGEDSLERVFRFIGGVLTSALGGRGDLVVGQSVVVRTADPDDGAHEVQTVFDRSGPAKLRIDVAADYGADKLREIIQQDLDRLSAGEFEQKWFHQDLEGQQVHDSQGNVVD